LSDLVGVAQVEMQGCIAIFAHPIIILFLGSVGLTCTGLLKYAGRVVVFHALKQGSNPLSFIPYILYLHLKKLLLRKRLMLLLRDVLIHKQLFELSELQNNHQYMCLETHTQPKRNLQAHRHSVGSRTTP